MEYAFTEEMKISIANIRRHIPLIKYLILPVINVANEIQKKHGDIYLRVRNKEETGIWKTSISVNTYTEELHTEPDCTYTILHVPQQKTPQKQKHIVFNPNLLRNIALQYVCINAPLYYFLRNH